MARASPDGRNHPFFVDGDEDEGVDCGEYGDRTCGDFKVGAEVAVGFVGLADEEGGELRE